MSTESLFQPLARAGGPSTATVGIVFNGVQTQVPCASSVAGALLAAGVKRFRNSPVSGDGRAPYCMMGVCFECLLEIDDVPNRQSCLVPLAAGMSVCTQDSLPQQRGFEAAPGLALAQTMEMPDGA